MCDTDDDGDGILDINEGYSFYVEDFEGVAFNSGISSGTTSVAGLNGIKEAHWSYNVNTQRKTHIKSCNKHFRQWRCESNAIPRRQYSRSRR